MSIHLSSWVKIIKVLVSHVNAHKRVTSAKEDFKNQVDSMTCLWILVILFPEEEMLPPGGKKKKDSQEWAVKISKSPLLAPPASE